MRFSNNHCLKGISIPASVTYIGENAFANCTNLDRINLEQITYANAHIDAYAFEGSAWQNKRDKEMFKIRGSHLIKAQTGKDLIVNIHMELLRLMDVPILQDMVKLL